MWTWWRCRRCGNNILASLQGKHKQAMYAKNKEWCSGSSSSSGGEEWKSQEQEEIKRLRAQVELLSKQQGTVKSPEEPGEPARRGSGLEEGCKMEFDEETDCKNKLEEQKKSLQRQLRDIEKSASMDPVFRDGQKETGKEELEEIARTRTELLPEHQTMQKRSQKLQSLRDKQRNHLKNDRDCEEEMQMLNKEMEERKALYETRFRALSEKSGDSRKAAAELENEIQTLQAGEERRGSSASQSNGCCFAPAKQVFAFGETRAASFYPIHAARVCQAVQNSRRSGAVGKGREERLGKRLG